LKHEILHIRKLSLESDTANAGKLASIHSKSLPNDILPHMGIVFLTKYYQFVLNNNQCVVLGIFLRNEIIGFCQISFVPISLLSILMKNSFFILAIIKLALIHPVMFLSGFIETFRQVFFKKGDYPEVSFIAILPDHQKNGFGPVLLHHVNALLFSHGYSHVFTKTLNIFAKKMYINKFNAKIDKAITIFDRKYWQLSWETIDK
jgi:GNAT superfamily N-acetyltransferase